MTTTTTTTTTERRTTTTTRANALCALSANAKDDGVRRARRLGCRASDGENEGGGGDARGGGGGASADAAATAAVKDKGVRWTYVLGAIAIASLACAGVLYREDLFAALGMFVEYVESLGPLGYALYFFGYVVLETFAVPAFPLTMSAGALFGTAQGTLLVTSAATVAAGIAFLIARYVARDKVQAFAEGYPKFKAIDRALEEDSFRVVAIMRLSPLMPFALSNYLYGLTSVNFKSYICGSFMGMMPGTFAYVSAGQATRQISEGALGSGAIFSTLLGVGLAIFSAGYVGKLASTAMCEENQICEEDFAPSASQD